MVLVSAVRRPPAPAPDGMNVQAMTVWLTAFGDAWERRNADAAAALFAPGATFQPSPFGELVRGRSGIAAWATAYKWLRRNRVEGEPGLLDRSSRPHRSPRALGRPGPGDRRRQDRAALGSSSPGSLDRPSPLDGVRRPPAGRSQPAARCRPADRHPGPLRRLPPGHSIAPGLGWRALTQRLDHGRPYRPAGRRLTARSRFG
jgi:hypothetical protein